MFEVRWAITPGWDGPEQALQYRTQVDVTLYDANNFDTGGRRLTSKQWTEWQWVPTVDFTKNEK